MPGEKPEFRLEEPVVRRTKSGAPHVSKIGTPKLPTDWPETALHIESHRESEARVDEQLAETTRDEILSHYQISPEYAVSLPPGKAVKREMRAFTILEDGSNPQRKYFADGHAPHAELLNFILTSFPEIGVKDRSNLPEDFLDKWKTRKGFIDPRRDGFKSFEATHATLQKLLLQNQEANGLNPEEVDELEHNPSAQLPNWFRTG